jgi:hypothetical protein
MSLLHSWHVCFAIVDNVGKGIMRTVETEERMEIQTLNMRVEIPTFTDWWMRGARFGSVVAVKPPRGKAGERWQVLLDANNKLIWVDARYCNVID